MGQWHKLDGSPIIVTENVFEYRRCIAEHIISADVAIEVGCAEGLTTALIAQQAHRVFGVDKSSGQVQKAVARHQHQHNLSFHEIEAWDLNSVLKMTAAAGVHLSVVFIDVSGSRRVGDVENLVMKYEQVFNPRLFVVKSYQLKRLINRCQLYFCPSNHNHKQQQAHLKAAGHPTAPVATCMAAEQLKAVDAAEPAVAACRDLCEQQQHQQQQRQEQHPPRHQQQEQHQQLAGSVNPALGQLGQAGLLAADVRQVPDSSGDT